MHEASVPGVAAVIALTRYQLSEFLWDESEANFEVEDGDPASLRAFLRALYPSRPLDALFTARARITCRTAASPPASLAALPLFLVLGNLIPFIDRKDLYGKFLNLCRWASRLPHEARWSTGEGIRGSSYTGSVLHVPPLINHATVFDLYWKAEKLLNMRGFFVLGTKNLPSNKPYCDYHKANPPHAHVIFSRPLFSGVNSKSYFPSSADLAEAARFQMDAQWAPCRGKCLHGNFRGCGSNDGGAFLPHRAASVDRLIEALKDEVSAVRRETSAKVSLPALQSVFVNCPPFRSGARMDWVERLQCPALSEVIIRGACPASVEQFLIAHQTTLKRFLLEMPDAAAARWSALPAFKQCGRALAFEIACGRPEVYGGLQHWDRVVWEVVESPVRHHSNAAPSPSPNTDVVEAVSVQCNAAQLYPQCAAGFECCFKVVSIGPRCFDDLEALLRSAKAIEIPDSFSHGLKVVRRLLGSASREVRLQELHVRGCGVEGCRESCSPGGAIPDCVVVHGPACRRCRSLFSELGMVRSSHGCPPERWQRRGMSEKSPRERRTAALFPLLLSSPEIFRASQGNRGASARLFAWNVRDRGMRIDCHHHEALRRMLTSGRPESTSPTPPSSMWFVDGCDCDFSWNCQFWGPLKMGCRYLSSRGWPVGGEHVKLNNYLWEPSPAAGHSAGVGPEQLLECLRGTMDRVA